MSPPRPPQGTPFSAREDVSFHRSVSFAPGPTCCPAVLHGNTALGSLVQASPGWWGPLARPPSCRLPPVTSFHPSSAPLGRWTRCSLTLYILFPSLPPVPIRLLDPPLSQKDASTGHSTRVRPHRLPSPLKTPPSSPHRPIKTFLVGLGSCFYEKEDVFSFSGCFKIFCSSFLVFIPERYFKGLPCDSFTFFLAGIYGILDSEAQLLSLAGNLSDVVFSEMSVRPALRARPLPQAPPTSRRGCAWLGAPSRTPSLLRSQPRPRSRFRLGCQPSSEPALP